MPTTTKNNKTTRRDRLRQFVNGVKLHLVPLKTVTINQVVIQVDDIVTKIEADIASCDAADKGHADWIQLVDQERASHTAIDPLVSSVKQIVRVQFGNTEAAQSILADFGMTPHKKRTATPKAKVAAAGKAKATRALLHTAGPKQKKTAKAQAAQTAQEPAPEPGTTPAQTAPVPATPPAATSAGAGAATTPSKA
jgi:hypothetical protein